MPDGNKASKDGWRLIKAFNQKSIDSKAEWSNAINQVYRVDFNFDLNKFSIYSLGAGQFLDFTFADSKLGLKGTDDAEKAGVYLLPPKKIK